MQWAGVWQSWFAGEGQWALYQVDATDRARTGGVVTALSPHGNGNWSQSGVGLTYYTYVTILHHLSVKGGEYLLRWNDLSGTHSHRAGGSLKVCAHSFITKSEVIHSHFKWLVCLFLWKPVSLQYPIEALDAISCRVMKPKMALNWCGPSALSL